MQASFFISGFVRFSGLLVQNALIHTEEGELSRGQQLAALAHDIHGHQAGGLAPVAQIGVGPDGAGGLVALSARV